MPAARPPRADRRRGALAVLLALHLALPSTAGAHAPVDPDRPDGGALQVEPGGDDAVRAAMRAELGLPEHPEVTRALALVEAHRHAEAAAVLEALAGSLADPRLLYHAALLRGLAGHHALAARHFDTFLGLRRGALTPAVRDYVDALHRAELDRTAEVILILVEGTGLLIPADQLARAQVTLRRPEGEAPAPGSVALRPGEAPLRIDAGRWELLIEHPDYAPTRTVVTAPAGREVTRWQITIERRRVLQELRFRPKRAIRRAQLRLTSSDLQPPRTIIQEIPGEQVTVPLTTGAWTLEASWRRYRVSQPILVRDPPYPIEVELVRPARPAGDTLQSDRKAHIAFAAVIGVSYIIGVGLLLGGVARDTRTEERNAAAFEGAGVDLAAGDPITPEALAAVESTYPTATYHRDLRRTSNLSTSGIVVAMAGASSALTVIPLVRRRRRGAYIEMGVGAAFLAGGAAWMASFARMQAALIGAAAEARASEADFDGLTGHRLGAGMLTGIGLGTVLGPAIVLLRDRLRRRGK